MGNMWEKLFGEIAKEMGPLADVARTALESAVQSDGQSDSGPPPGANAAEPAGRVPAASVPSVAEPNPSPSLDTRPTIGTVHPSSLPSPDAPLPLATVRPGALPSPDAGPAAATVEPRSLPDPAELAGARAGTASTVTYAPHTVHIELDQLQPNPFQPRGVSTSEQIQELAESIRIHGLLEPISARKVPSGYQIIFGHRRVSALSRLCFSATTPEEEARYQAVPARILPDVTDAQMMLWAWIENVQRSSLSPLETAIGLLGIRDFNPQVKSAKDLSRLTGLNISKVKRLLRLAGAPAVVQAAVKEGITIPAEEDPDDDRPENERPTEQHRTVDLMGALEFARLHAYLLNKCAGKKDAQRQADAKTSEAVRRALKSEWGLRQIRHFVDEMLAGKNRERASRGRPKEAFTNNPRQLVIYHARIANLSPSEKSALKQLLEPLWKLISDAS